MKFKHGTRRRALEYEKDWVQRWKEDGTFEKSVESRPVDNAYVFYDGPPFITGVPHHGTLLSSIVKDAVPRYWTMKGKRVERVWGWDCHGLPAENFVEKQLNITDRRQIVTNADEKAPLDKDGNELPTITLEQYITKARESMVANSATWEGVIDRIGRWVDFRGAYRTMDKNFMESVWWAFKELYEKGKIYEGEKVLMYDTRFATPVSKNEVTMDNDAYQTVTDPSVYVKFRINPKYVQAESATFNFGVNKSGYIGMDVTNAVLGMGLPGELLGMKLKNEFHISLAKLPDNIDGELKNKIEKVSIEASEMLKKNPPKLSLEFRLATDGEARTIIARVVPNLELEKWRDRLRAIEPDLLFHFPHITLYKNEQAGFGIPVRTEAVYDSITTSLPAVDEKVLLRAAKSSEMYLLAWTTTPWTLPGNTALAVNKDLEYVEVKTGDEQFILAKDLVEKVLQDEKHQPLDYEVVRTLKGKELIGKSYEPLFADHGKNAHKVWAADYVSSENGTGIVHLAPIYGEEDFVLAQENDIPRVHVLDDNGYYFPEVAAELYKLMPWVDASKPIEVWENNKNIAKGLEKAGIVWKTEYIRHEYPFNPRSKQRIMYRAIPSWFFDVQGSKPLMLEQNGNVNWFPEHLKRGRFAKNIEQAPDWNLSRDRFWATAMPVWKGDKGTVKVVGSYAELKELSGVELEDYHRPWVDDITFEQGGEKFTRIEKVLDCWFESGSMPFAQFHYPFENKEKFEANFPGDFIVEYVGQVRAWFYYVHTISTALFGTEGFKNVIVTGNAMGNDGRKLSKSLGNFTDPNEVMDKFSADSLRFLLLSSPLLSGEDFVLNDKDVGDVARKLSMAWNMYDFFTMYAEVDGWEYDGSLEDPLEDASNPLDIWIISRVHQLTSEVEKHMDTYNLPDAMSPILPFLDDASNWYVRRSRRRFWKSEDDSDKEMAYRTLHYVLVRLSYVLAPFTPFLAEELYHNLTGDKESIHLKDWLSAGHINEISLEKMDMVRRYIEDGLRQRAEKGVKVRQPLASAVINSYAGMLDDDLLEIINEELNVKGIVQSQTATNNVADTTYGIEIDWEITPTLKREGLMREIIRHVQAARKSAGLNVDDHIRLSLAAHPDDDTIELKHAIEEHAQTIAEETLADEFADISDGYETTVKVESMELRIGLEKA